MNQTGQARCWPDEFDLGASVPLEDAGTGKEIAEKVRAGEALLEIVSTPWGAEFYLCELVRRK